MPCAAFSRAASAATRARSLAANAFPSMIFALISQSPIASQPREQRMSVAGEISIVLRRAVSPPAMRSRIWERPALCASSATSAALALPSSGGTATRDLEIFSAVGAAAQPSMASRPPLGVRRTRKVSDAVAAADAPRARSDAIDEIVQQIVEEILAAVRCRSAR